MLQKVFKHQWDGEQNCRQNGTFHQTENYLTANGEH